MDLQKMNAEDRGLYLEIERTEARLAQLRIDRETPHLRAVCDEYIDRLTGQIATMRAQWEWVQSLYNEE